MSLEIHTYQSADLRNENYDVCDNSSFLRSFNLQIEESQMHKCGEELEDVLSISRFTSLLRFLVLVMSLLHQCTTKQRCPETDSNLTPLQ